MNKDLVRLRIRPSRNGRIFKYMLDYVDADGKRRRMSLGHADRRKAERQRAQKERELRMGVLLPESMKLSDFLEDSLIRTGSQIRESTQALRRDAMEHFIRVIGDIDYQRVTLGHAELFRQTCLDEGKRPATVSKKLRQLKRIFQLAANRKQLDENPLKHIGLPKWTKGKVRVFSEKECERMFRVVVDSADKNSLRWDLLFYVALTTGMRRGELLNAVWADVDFERKTIDVSPKENTAETWQWEIKDSERRTLNLDDKAVAKLAEHQTQQPEKYPYIFIPPQRYVAIQELRRQGKWSLSDSRLKVINNFDRKFKKILKQANVDRSRFHDLRSTALTNALLRGISEYELMRMAGHESFNTTHKFYLAVKPHLWDKTKSKKPQGIGKKLARAWHAPFVVSENV